MEDKKEAAHAVKKHDQGKKEKKNEIAFYFGIICSETHKMLICDFLQDLTKNEAVFAFVSCQHLFNFLCVLLKRTDQALHMINVL